MDITQIIQRLNHEGCNRLLADIETIDTDSRKISLAFSSERAEVPRWFGSEILGHHPGEVRLDRINDGGPLLMDHDGRDQVGVVESAHIDADGVGRATVRFGQSKRAEEIFQDVKDRIRRHVSVGYVVHNMKLVEERNDEPIYRVTDWEPTEISIVSVPADHTIGVNRALSPPDIKTPSGKDDSQAEISSPSSGESRMASAATLNTDPAENRSAGTPNTVPAQPTRTYEDEKEAALRANQKRVSDILSLGRQYNALDLAADFAARPEASLTEFQRVLLDKQGKAEPLKNPNSDIGMTQKDLRNFSILRAVRGLTAKDPRTRDEAGFEFEVSQEAAKKQTQRNSDGLIIPSDVLRHNVSGEAVMLRDGSGSMNTGSNGLTGPGNTGGAAIQTSVLAGSYIEILRNKAVFARGARVLGGLIGNLSIPRQTAATQGYWLGEGDEATFSAMDFGSVELKPKTSAANTVITRRLMEQSSMDVEALVRADLARSMALTIDRSGYYGTGSDKQPLGLAKMPGITALNFAGPHPTYEELVEMETLISEANADAEGMVYKARPSFRGYAKTTLEFQVSGSRPIWEKGGTVNGYVCDITNQIEQGDMFFGNFNDVLLGMWGGLELIADPYTLSTSGKIVLTTFQDIDWQFRRTESFMIGKAGGSPATPASKRAPSTPEPAAPANPEQAAA